MYSLVFHPIVSNYGAATATEELAPTASDDNSESERLHLEDRVCVVGVPEHPSCNPLIAMLAALFQSALLALERVTFGDRVLERCAILRELLVDIRLVTPSFVSYVLDLKPDRCGLEKTNLKKGGANRVKDLSLNLLRGSPDSVLLALAIGPGLNVVQESAIPVQKGDSMTLPVRNGRTPKPGNECWYPSVSNCREALQGLRIFVVPKTPVGLHAHEEDRS